MIEKVKMDDPVEAPGKLKRQKSKVEDNTAAEGNAVVGVEEEEDADPEVLRVRTAAGSVIVAFCKSEVADDMTGEALKKLVGEKLGKSDVEIQLVADGSPLPPKSLVKDYVAAGKVQELLVLTLELPDFDASASALSQLPALKKMLFSEALAVQLCGMQHVRKMLSIENNPPIHEVIEAGMVPRMLELAQVDDSDQLKFEALWALTNIASGTSQQTATVVDAGGVPVFVTGLVSENAEICEQSVWALGNISGDSPDNRNMVLNSGVLTPLLDVLNRESERAETPISLLRNATWCLSNLCRGKPTVDKDQVAPALPVLARLIADNDTEVQTDACWAMSYFTDISNDAIEMVVGTGCCQQLADNLAHDSPMVITPALRTCGNIVTGTDTQTQAMLDCGVLERFPALLSSAKKSIRKESCWFLSNVLAGTRPQIEAVISAGLLPQIMELSVAPDFDVKKEGLWCIMNLCTGGSDESITEAVKAGCIPALVGGTEGVALGRKKETLDSLVKVLEVGERRRSAEVLPRNPFSELVQQSPGFDQMGMSRCDRSEDGSDVDDECQERVTKILEMVGEADGPAPPAPTLSGSPSAQAARAKPQVDKEFEEEAVTGLGPNEYGVNLLLMQDRLLGVSMMSAPPKSCPKPGTLLYDWNRRHPDRPVGNGDPLLAVNGVRDDFGRMRGELKRGSRGSRLQLVFKRASA